MRLIIIFLIVSLSCIYSWAQPQDGIIYVILNRHSQKVLDIPGGSRSLGVQVQQWEQHSNTNQQWRVTKHDGFYFTLTNMASGLCLGVRDRKDDKAPIVQSGCRGFDSQLWGVVTSTSGYHQIGNKFSGKVMDVPGFLTGNGVKIQQFTKKDFNNITNASNQLFKFLYYDDLN